MIEASQRMIDGKLNSPPVNEYFKLQIKTLKNAPRPRQIVEAFEIKANTRRRSYAHGRYLKVSYKN